MPQAQIDSGRHCVCILLSQNVTARFSLRQPRQSLIQPSSEVFQALLHLNNDIVLLSPASVEVGDNDEPAAAG